MNGEIIPSDLTQAKPESPRTREFIHGLLIDHFGIFHENSELRPTGRRRGFRHSEEMGRLTDVLMSQVEQYNEANPDMPIELSRRAIPKVLHELNILKIIDYAQAGDRLVYFEAHLFGEGKYVEDHTEDVFRFSPPGQTVYYHGDHKK